MTQWTLNDYINMATRCIRKFRGNYVGVMLRDDDAISLVAEGLMKSYTTWTDDKGASLKTYLSKKSIWIIKNWIKKYSKDKHRNRTVSLNAMTEGGQEMIDFIIKEEKRENIDIGLIFKRAGLSPKQSEVLTRMFIGNERESEIAKELGVSRQAIEQLHKNGLEKIKKVLVHA